MCDYTKKCFAESVGKRCSKCRVLTYKFCIGHEKCAHYKSEDRCKEEERKRIERLQNLPEEVQKHIEETYKVEIWKES